MNLAALVAYDGTRFAGFQRQSPDKGPTVQGALEEALRRIAGEAITIEGAGRTDTGVHASGQVVNALVPARLAPKDWQRALNALLPPDVAVRAACEAPPEFRARRSAVSRGYRYRILRDAVRSPLRERYAWRVAAPLDVAAMQAAATLLLGEHDFAAFGSSPGRGGAGMRGGTVRRLFEAECRQLVAAGEPDEVECRFTANAFLTGMVRRLVGALALVGEGRLTVADFRAILEARDGNHPGAAAPACGLCLSSVEYPVGLISWAT
ncbi:MAG TPA: tRNA pseudouridine(38-40) synthase TruA [Gemmatimonadales bacterium]|nr:tRNA pseudouridine(38-40) synthase TruA [Gemmatimonadales bacterium]